MTAWLSLRPFSGHGKITRILEIHNGANAVQVEVRGGQPTIADVINSFRSGNLQHAKTLDEHNGTLGDSIGWHPTKPA